MVTLTDAREASDHVLVSLAHFGDSSNTPWILLISFPAVQTEPTLTKFLLSLAVQLGLQFHLLRIHAALISYDSISTPHKL